MSERFQIFGDDSHVADTCFAPAQRATRQQVEASIEVLAQQPLLKALLDATDVSVVVLNRERQIIVGNSVLLDALGAERFSVLQGLRPGEAMGCIHAHQCAGGCGTAPECSKCGAVLAVLESQRTRATVERECLMTVRKGDGIDAYELQVKASWIEIGGEIFTVVGLRDISDVKRRAALERIFLHDISNSVGPLLTWSELLATRAPEELRQTAGRLAALAKSMQRDIEDQRTLLQAESGTLELRRSVVPPHQALLNAATVLSGHSVARDRSIVVEPRSSDAPPIVTDESLLVRVLVNMMKNALEATERGGTVRAWAQGNAEGCELSVWNAAAIEPQAALQVFKRSFSTKPGVGRGLGTFSMKLFGERYLGGRVEFKSGLSDGTVFSIRLPSGANP